MKFPENFVWGSAAASYQIEGAAYKDGKGLSVWDTFSNIPEKIKNEHNGDVACNHFDKYKEDVDLMGDIGLQAYRLSISWPRIIPDGVGKINEKGLDFYDRLIDKLLEKNIDPWITLFHWDYPYELYCRGGWLNKDSSDWFAEYTKIVVDKISDRVKNWMTLNEPQCFIGFGHLDGTHAPGLKLGFKDILRISHNVLLAHGKSVKVIRENSKLSTNIGYAPVGVIGIPKDNTKENIEIARQASFAVKRKDVWNNSWFSDPIILGHYPEDGLKLFKDDLPEITETDMKIINQPIDFYGCNIYFETEITKQKHEGAPRTTMGWKINPEVLYWGPKFFYERYKLPIIITENGMANCDWVHADGKVHDPQRIDYINNHIKSFGKSIADGVDGKGYFVWSILDNFEWAEGYDKRFGLIYVDYKTQQRIMKDSAFWYKDVITNNGGII